MRHWAPVFHARGSTRSFCAKATDYLPNFPDYTPDQTSVREAIAKICSRFPESYWLDVDRTAKWPGEFQKAIAKEGWLGICMPEEYGGSALGLAEATVMMQVSGLPGSCVESLVDYIDQRN